MQLLNAIASDRTGRAYLLQPQGHVIAALLQLLGGGTQHPGCSTDAASGMNGSSREELQQQQEQQEREGKPRDTVLQAHALAALQKLSLKRKAQSSMIQLGVVPWVVGFLAGDTEGGTAGAGAKGSPNVHDKQPGSRLQHGYADAEGQAAATEGTEITPSTISSGGAGNHEEVGHVAASGADAGSSSSSARKSTTGQTEGDSRSSSSSGGGGSGASGANSAAAGVATLSEYSLEYGCALLMNLVLRMAGALAAAEACGDRLLDVCAALLECGNEQVRWVSQDLGLVAGLHFFR